MHSWLRNTHLLAGLFFLSYLLVYGVSSVQMVHRSWFQFRPTASERRVTVRAGQEDGRTIARQLMDEHDVRGELNQVQKTPTGLRLRIGRPGTNYEVDYVTGTGEARIRQAVAPFQGMLNRLHTISGLWHEYSLLNFWGGLVGLASLGMLVMGATGVYLWFKLYNERAIGVVLLVISLGYSLTLIVLMRVA